jgi:prevent-host-death family protein
MRINFTSWLRQGSQAALPKPTRPYYNTYEARNALSELLRRVRHGEVIVIAHAGRPVAQLVPYREEAELVPGLVRLSVYVDGTGPGNGNNAATPTRSSPAVSTSRPARRDSRPESR